MENLTPSEEPYPAEKDLPKSPSGRTPKWVIEEMEKKADGETPVADTGKTTLEEKETGERIYPSDIIPDRDIPESSNRKLFMVTAAVIVGWVILLIVPFIIASR